MRQTLYLLLAAALLLPAPAGAQAAHPAAPPGKLSASAPGFTAAGSISGIVVHPADPTLRYLRTTAGAYRWDPAQSRWLPLLDALAPADHNLLGIESLTLDPSDPAKLYLAAGTDTKIHTPNGAILRSSDNGRHFEITRLPFPLGAAEEGRFSGERLAVDPNHGQTLLLATPSHGLWRSADSGATWHPVREFPALPLNKIGLTFVAFDRSSGTQGRPTPVILIGVCDPFFNLLRSDDAGRSWKPVLGGPSGIFPNHGILAADGTLYLSYSDSLPPAPVRAGGVWAYTPRTGKWRNLTPSSANLPTASGYGFVAVSAHLPTLLTAPFGSSAAALLRSTDAGAHWTALLHASDCRGSLGTASGPIGAALFDPADPARILYSVGSTLCTARISAPAAKDP